MTHPARTLLSPPNTGDAPELIFNGAREGVWLDANPLSNFRSVVDGLASPPAYGAVAGNEFARWIDRSGNNRDGFETVLASRPFPTTLGGYANGLVYDAFSLPGIGGATTAFYICWSGFIESYYGTLLSDLGTAFTGFRLQHDADNLASQGDIYLSVGNGTARVNLYGVADLTPAFTAWDGNHTIEAGWDGAFLRLRIDGGVETSVAFTGMAAGLADVTLSAADQANLDLTNTRTAQLVYVKNYYPTLAERNAIYAYSAPLIGVPGNVAVGFARALTATVAKAVTGNAAAGSVGNLKGALGKALTGNGSIGSAGTGLVSVSGTSLLAGTAATAVPGTSAAITVDRSIGGVAATATPGNVTVDLPANIVLGGVAASGAAQVVDSSASAALPSVAATGAAQALTATLVEGVLSATATGAAQGLASALATVQGLTGTAGLGSAQNVPANLSKALIGAAAPGVAGGVGVAQALGGAAATGLAPVLTAAVANPIGGALANSAANTISATVTSSLNSAAAAGSPGSVAVPPATALLGVAAVGVPGLTVPGLSAGLLGTSAAGFAGTLGSTVAPQLTGAAAATGKGSVTASTALVTPSTVATSAVGALTVFGSAAIAGSGAACATGTFGVTVVTGLSGLQAVGQTQSITASTPGTVSLGSVAAGAAAGAIGVSVSGAGLLSGVGATGLARVLTAFVPPPAGPGKSGFSRQALIDYYTREWEIKPPTVAAPRQHKTIVAQAVAKSVPDLQTDKLERLVATAQARTTALINKVALTSAIKPKISNPAKLTHKIFRPETKDEDEDEILLFSVM